MLHVKQPRRCLAVSSPARRHALPRRRAVPFLPRLEALEGRWVPTTVTNLLDSGAGSLRQAILDTPAGGTVDFEPGLTGTIALTTSQLTITRDLTIAGPGADVLTVSGNNARRVFEVAPAATVTLSGLTIANGRVTGFARGGGISNAGALTVTAATLSGNSGGFEGGIYNSPGGALTVTASTLSRNSAGFQGGGIYNDSGGVVTVTASTLNGNSASSGGGGIYNSNGGTLTVTDSIFSGNSATSGGGIYNSNGGVVTVTASTLSGNSVTGNGGGIFNPIAGTVTVTASTLSGNSANLGGGIINAGRVTVTASTLNGNSVTGFGGAGGGIYNSNGGALTVTASTLSSNSAIGPGGGIYNSNAGVVTVTASTLSGNSATFSLGGGGIFNNFGGVVTITASTLSGNSANLGGGIYSSSNGMVTVTASTLSGNAAIGNGGGIYNDGGTLSITASTLSGNSANNDNGGGIVNNSGGVVTIAASTLSGNSATGNGGGIYNYFMGTLTVTASTLSGNSANLGGGIYNFSVARTVTASTLVAGNTAASAPDVYGTLTSQGHNLIGDGSGGSGFLDTDLVGTAQNPIDPRLAPLGDYGGPTFTHALLAGSPALDAGDNADATEFDQRGWNFARVIGGRTDIGAFERPVGPQLVRQSVIRTLGPVRSLRVTFDRAMDPASFTPDKIWFFSGPLGDIPVTAVNVAPDSGDRQFDITFPEQVITSLYAMHIGPNILDADGVPMDHDPSGPPGEFGDMYIAQFGIEGPRVMRSDPAGAAGGPVERVRLTFNTAITAATFEPRDVYYWVGPEGAVAVGGIELVAGSGDRQFDVVPRRPLTAPGRYWLALWPDVRDSWGNPMDQDDDLIAGEGIEDGYVAVFDLAGSSPSGPGPNGGVGDDLGAAVAALLDVAGEACAGGQPALSGPEHGPASSKSCPSWADRPSVVTSVSVEEVDGSYVPGSIPLFAPGVQGLNVFDTATSKVWGYAVFEVG